MRLEVWWCITFCYDRVSTLAADLLTAQHALLDNLVTAKADCQLAATRAQTQ